MWQNGIFLRWTVAVNICINCPAAFSTYTFEANRTTQLWTEFLTIGEAPVNHELFYMACRSYRVFPQNQRPTSVLLRGNIDFNSIICTVATMNAGHFVTSVQQVNRVVVPGNPVRYRYTIPGIALQNYQWFIFIITNAKTTRGKIDYGIEAQN